MGPTASARPEAASQGAAGAARMAASGGGVSRQEPRRSAAKQEDEQQRVSRLAVSGACDIGAHWVQAASSVGVHGAVTERACVTAHGTAASGSTSEQQRREHKDVQGEGGEKVETGMGRETAVGERRAG